MRRQPDVPHAGDRLDQPVQAAAGKAFGPNNAVYALVTETGSTRGLSLFREVNGTAVLIAASSGAVTALTLNTVYHVRYVQRGLMGRAELWTAPQPRPRVQRRHA